MERVGLDSTHSRVIAAIALVGFALIGAIWVAMLERAKLDLSGTVAEAYRQNANIAIALEEHAAAKIRSVEQVARSIRSEYAARGASTDIAAIRKAMVDDTLFAVASVTDEHGNVVLSNRPAAGVSYADRDFFKHQLLAQKDEFYIDRPVLGRISGTWQIPMSLRIAKADGSFGGVVVLSLDPDSFAAFYRKADIGAHGLLMLVCGVAQACPSADLGRESGGYRADARARSATAGRARGGRGAREAQRSGSLSGALPGAQTARRCSYFQRSRLPLGSQLSSVEQTRHLYERMPVASAWRVKTWYSCGRAVERLPLARSMQSLQGSARLWSVVIFPVCSMIGRRLKHAGAIIYRISSIFEPCFVLQDVGLRNS